MAPYSEEPTKWVVRGLLAEANLSEANLSVEPDVEEGALGEAYPVEVLSPVDSEGYVTVRHLTDVLEITEVARYHVEYIWPAPPDMRTDSKIVPGTEEDPTIVDVWAVGGWWECEVLKVDGASITVREGSHPSATLDPRA